MGGTVAMRNCIAFVSIPFSHGGRVAVFNQNQTASGWQRVQTLNAPVPNAGFGRTIVFRDGLTIVGDETAAYVYKRNSNGVWTPNTISTRTIESPRSALVYRS